LSCVCLKSTQVSWWWRNSIFSQTTRTILMNSLTIPRFCLKIIVVSNKLRNFTSVISPPLKTILNIMNLTNLTLKSEKLKENKSWKSTKVEAIQTKIWWLLESALLRILFKIYPLTKLLITQVLTKMKTSLLLRRLLMSQLRAILPERVLIAKWEVSSFLTFRVKPVASPMKTRLPLIWDQS
jgi:hypothetical protein